MDTFEKLFDWVQFAEGRARFSGIMRGWDERGHTTFALELNGVEYFGEIDQVFLPDRHNFNIEVISFGYRRGEDVGMPNAAAVFSLHEIGIAERLIIQLVKNGVARVRPPNILQQAEDSRFMGLVFRDGWVLASPGDVCHGGNSTTSL